MALDLTTLLPKRDDTYVGTMAKGLVGSEILRIAAEIRELTAQGRKVCNLTVGDFSPREFPIPEALGKAMRSTETKLAGFWTGVEDPHPDAGKLLDQLRVPVEVLLERRPLAPAVAQTSKGFVTGVVEDPNGAGIANASIKITNLTTGVSRDTVAESSAALKPGSSWPKVTVTGSAPR